MPFLTDLPIELLSRIADLVAINKEFIRYPEDDYDNPYVEERGTFKGLSSQQSKLAIAPPLDLESLRALRSVSKLFSEICSPLIFRIVRVVATEESVDRFVAIVESQDLNRHVNKIVFQTREDLDCEHADCEHADCEEEPCDFFLEAMDKVGLLSNLMSAELVFGSYCAGEEDYYNDDVPEQVDFREPILERFFAALNSKDCPATGVYNLSIKNLQDRTPRDLMADTDSDFKTDFHQVMSRMRHLSLKIVTEIYRAAPENTLQIKESHEFFGEELNKYWLEPFRENLTYLKLYGDLYWGYFPRSHLPTFPNLRTLVLGNMTFSHDEQLDCICAHANTLEELILDDCPIIAGGRVIEHSLGLDRHVIREPGDEHSPVSPQETWTYEMRWHHYLSRLRTELPDLKHFAWGHGPWMDSEAYDEADALTTCVHQDRYVHFNDSQGPSSWNVPSELGWKINVLWGDGHEDEIVYVPDCLNEDLEALKGLLDAVRKRR